MKQRRCYSHFSEVDLAESITYKDTASIYSIMSTPFVSVSVVSLDAKCRSLNFRI